MEVTVGMIAAGKEVVIQVIIELRQSSRWIGNAEWVGSRHNGTGFQGEGWHHGLWYLWGCAVS